MSLYHELKRRNVFRVAIAYLALAWLLTEVSGTLFPAFGIPDWGVRFVVIVFALGFVPALIISWVYEGLGDQEYAALSHRRFINLWQDCDPEFERLVEALRRAMERLTSEPNTD